MGLTVGLGLADEPLEQGQSLLHALRMPLNAKDALELGTLDGLDDAVLGRSHNAELIASIADSLVVERVDV